MVGAGSFGWNHLLVWRRLARQGLILFTGVVEKNSHIRKKLKHIKIPVFKELTPDLLANVSAVDIVTPPSTHYAIAQKSLIYTHVFLEKPMALFSLDARKLNGLAKKYQRHLMIGHIYRFNGAIQKLKELLTTSDTKPFFFECTFIDSPHQLPADCGILFSDLHAFDILDYLLDSTPKLGYATLFKNKIRPHFEIDATVLLHYAKEFDVTVKLSWRGIIKTRLMNIWFPDKKIVVDFIKQTITVFTSKEVRKFNCAKKNRPLDLELIDFIDILKNKKIKFPDGSVGLRIIRIVEQLYLSAQKKQQIKFFPDKII